MKIRDGFVLREIADTVVVVPTGDLVYEFNNIINLNQTGKFIWELLQNDITIEEIENKMVQRYDLDREKAKEETEKFVNQLKNANFIEE